MAKDYTEDDTFLGRWIAGELSEEALEAFKKTEAYKQFEIINRASQDLEGPEIDTEAALRLVKEKINAKNSKPTKVRRLWYSLSAVAILVISLGLFFTSSKTYTTAIGEQQTVTLADGSVVHLNANSSLSLKRFFWENNKVLNLTGEAYFTVTKGDDFKVKTSKGTVSVLGTEFNIKDRNHFEVTCYEGKVSFEHAEEMSEGYILTKGQSIAITNGNTTEAPFDIRRPYWRKHVSSFKDQPFYIVLDELTNYFPVEFKTNNIDVNRLYTGSFNHKDTLDQALEKTLAPMGINYDKTTRNNVILITLSK